MRVFIVISLSVLFCFANEISLKQGWNLKGVSDPIENINETFKNASKILGYDGDWYEPESIGRNQGFWVKNSKNEVVSLNSLSYPQIEKRSIALYNEAAYVPSQCYTKMEDGYTNIYNPCYSCHVNNDAPNYINDADVQEGYSTMSDYTRENRWSNLFVDRTEKISKISDNEILSYIRQSNYFDQNGEIVLAKKLNSLSSNWDFDDDGLWSGYVPDCYFNFDEDGFDKNNVGDYTGWRAFTYYPFLGTFWPTNGSTDDVLIRLSEEFRKNKDGNFDIEVYKINLSIIESLLKKSDIDLFTIIDENKYGVDLNQNGILDSASKVVYKWVTPTYNFESKKYENYSMSYVGAAKDLLDQNEVNIAPGLYPKDTEFLHTVRYIDIDDSGKIKMSARMKEVRYGRKKSWNTYSQLSNAALEEIKEADAFPDRLRTVLGNFEEGLDNSLGWVFQGFIEDKQGELRPQTYEESLNCIGCHSGIGGIEDGTFAFARKIDHSNGASSWTHWSQSSLEGVKEPLDENGNYEYSYYLYAAGGGDEFRENEEVMEKFFDGTELKADMLQQLHDDISLLLFPSSQRALSLNKAYKTIVDEQSFIYGRDTVIKAAQNVHKEIDDETFDRVYSDYGIKNDEWYVEIAPHLYTWSIQKSLDSHETLIPQKEKVDEPTHSYRVDDLLFVTEREESKIAVIDGDSLEVVKRLDSGFRAHGYTFDPSGRYGYNLGRDGWLYKYDLFTLKPAAKVKVGIDARGIAVSDDGKYVIAGLYVPMGAMILDADTLEPLKFIDTSSVNSRVCSVNDVSLSVGSYFLLALKEVGEVWRVDFSNTDFKVTKTLEVGDMLHDGFLSSDNKIFFIATKDYLSAIDVENMSIVKNIETGDMPHPGSAASWSVEGKDYVATLHLGEGKHTIIDTDTLEIAGNVKTSAGGMNNRTNSKMKYIWTDTMYEPYKNEITIHQKYPPFEIVKTITDGIFTLHPEPDADGDYVFVSDWDADVVRVYDDETLELVKTIEGIKTPTGIFSTYRINETLGH